MARTDHDPVRRLVAVAAGLVLAPVAALFTAAVLLGTAAVTAAHGTGSDLLALAAWIGVFDGTAHPAAPLLAVFVVPSLVAALLGGMIGLRGALSYAALDGGLTTALGFAETGFGEARLGLLLVLSGAAAGSVYGALAGRPAASRPKRG